MTGAWGSRTVTLASGGTVDLATGATAVARLDRSAAAAGLITGVRTIHKFGYNAAVTNTEVVVWAAAAAYTGFLTAASTVRIRAGGNAADTAAGVGAQSIMVQGLLAGVEVSETIVTAGASASTSTTQTFDRVHRAWVVDAGSYSTGVLGGNTGNILIETTAGVLVGQIAALSGQTQIAVYTVPAGYTAYLMHVDATVDGSSSQSASIRLYQRQGYTTVSAPYASRRIVEQWPSVTSVDDATMNGYVTFPALTDIWVTAQKVGGGAAVGVNASFGLELRAT